MTEALDIFAHTPEGIAARQQRAGKQHQNEKLQEAVHRPCPDKKMAQ